MDIQKSYSTPSERKNECEVIFKKMTYILSRKKLIKPKIK